MKRKFGRKRNQRKALLKGLAVALISHGRIKTSVARAKELKAFAERLVTHAKNKQAQVAGKEISKSIGRPAAKKLMRDIAPKYASRRGGYTRIIKMGRREVDAAEMVLIEWV